VLHFANDRGKVIERPVIPFNAPLLSGREQWLLTTDESRAATLARSGYAATAGLYGIDFFLDNTPWLISACREVIFDYADASFADIAKMAQIATVLINHGVQVKFIPTMLETFDGPLDPMAIRHFTDMSCKMAIGDPESFIQYFKDFAVEAFDCLSHKSLCKVQTPETITSIGDREMADFAAMKEV
jgi:hypothetical protein